LDPHVDGLLEILPYVAGVAERLVRVRPAGKTSPMIRDLHIFTGPVRDP